MKALILAAGRASSLHPFSGSRAAPMIKLCGRYVIEEMLNLLRQAGIADVVIVIDPGSERIPAALGDGGRYGVSIQYVRQKIDGIGGAILGAEDSPRSREQFLLVYGDTLTRRNIFAETLRSPHEHHAPAAAGCLPHPPQRYGNTYMAGDMRI